MSSDSATPRYRRRRRWPMLLVMAILLAGAGFVWLQALKPAPAVSTGCNTPGPAPTTASQSSRSRSGSATGSNGPAAGSTAGSAATGTGSAAASTGVAGSAGAETAASTTVKTTLGTFTDPNTLADTRPADPGSIVLTVLNAGQVVGQAKTVTDELRAAGFSSIQPQANDPLYPAGDLTCFGEIRYGPAGAAQARTVLIMAPCAQLVVDNRLDDSVDLALGARYIQPPTSNTVKTELTAIKNAAAPPAVIEGQTAAAKPLPPIPALPKATCPS